MKTFVCFTPLHVLIAERIIEIEAIKEYIFIYFTDIDTKKNKYYYAKLAEKSLLSHYIILKKNILKDLTIIYKLWKDIKPLVEKNKAIYYTGKIKSSHVRLLMYLSTYKNLITFDDGSGNISGAGYFYDTNENILFKSFFYIFNKKLLYKNIKNHNIKHYTIFNLPNVFQNTVLINLFTINNIPLNIKKKKLVVLLTNAFAEDSEMKLSHEITLYEKIIKNYNVSHIIKHPREQYLKVSSSNVKELISMKISEELMYELSLEYDITVIGIYSTTLFTLAKFKDINTINIHAELKKPINNIKNILENIGIETYYV